VESGWDIETGDPGIVIAVIGTGVELSHPDLAQNIWENLADIEGNGIDDDLNGFVDDRWGWDFYGDDNDPSATTATHETQVAGVAGAVANNFEGITGTAWNCRIMALRVAYSSMHVAQSIDYAATNGAQVINMSFGNYSIGKYGQDTIVETAVDEAFADGVVLVATAGNNSISTERYPAALENVIAVAATDSLDERAGFSNYGSWVTVAAPGTGILTTTIGSDYVSSNGTSFAAPYVAGLAGLLLSKDMSLSPTSVRRRIEYSVDRIDTDLFIGTGRVNVFNALALTSDPALFAVIKSPLDSTLVSEAVRVVGTALGGQYLLEYRASDVVDWTPVASGSEVVDGELGVVDLRDAESGLYELRLTASLDGVSDVDQISLFVEHSVMTGWPRTTGSAIVSSPSYADIDGDGDVEVFVSNNAGEVHGWHHDGTPVSGWPASGSSYMFGGPSIGDIDGDGDVEVVQASYAPGGYVHAWHHNGVAVSGWPRSAAERVRGAVALADLDGDGALEMVLTGGGACCGLTGTVHAWRSDGSELPNWPIQVESNVQTTPAVGDLDGDGDLEVVVHAWENIYAFHHDASTVAGWPIAYAGTHTSPLVADIDGDGSDEVVAFGHLSIQILDGDGAPRSTTFSQGGAFAYSEAALGDVNGDGRPEICVGDDDGDVYVVDVEAGLRPGWPVRVGGDVTACSVADVDGDGLQEIVAASEDSLVYAWNGDGTAAPGVWPKPLSSPLFSTAAAGDLDGDGAIDLMIGNAEGDFYVYELGTPFNSTAAHWPMFRGSAQRDGRYNIRPVCGDLDGDEQITEADVDLLRAYLVDPLGSPLSVSAPSRCSVIDPPGPCSVRDVTVIRRALAGLPPGVAQVCAAATP
jgi:subtilisin family serine protease